jgi:pimeloyl-ACP methyl ester carboxylesterase
MRDWAAVRGVCVLCLLVAALAGCAQGFAERMVAPPNMRGQDGDPAVMPAQEGKGDRRIILAVGPPKANLAAWVLEPAGDRPVRGTVLVLHGIIANHDWVRGEAEELRKAGFRAVLVDLRGHGESTGEHITYGVVESRDLRQLVDYLQANKLCGPTLGVYGVSYGAATAIQYAALDRRVTAVVAVASFATLRDEAPHFGRQILPIPGLFLSDGDYVEVVTAAGKIAGFDPDAASPLAAIGKTRARVLLMHGGWDAVIPAECSARLHAASPGNSELRILKAQGHVGTTLGLDGAIGQAAGEWFERYVSAEPAAAASAKESS